MPDKSARNPGNVAGPWYVDSSCIACGLCADLAPGFFKMADDGSTAFVQRQPLEQAEKVDAVSAMEQCPVQAIGDDA